MPLVSGRDFRSGPNPAAFPIDENAPGEKPARLRPMVLLVDDIEDCRDVYGQFLRHTGYDVVEAVDGNEALAKASALGPDAIVMDLWMPHLDGWESIRRLKAAPATAGIPILVLTGDAYAQARRDAEEAGCNAYLVKPCLPMDVAAQVGRLLIDAKASPSGTSAVRVMTERRSGGRRHSETGGGVLASVVADLDRDQHELGQQLRALEDELHSGHDTNGTKKSRLQQRLAAIAEKHKALTRHLGALKVIARSADVRITIPARRGPRRS